MCKLLGLRDNTKVNELVYLVQTPTLIPLRHRPPPSKSTIIAFLGGLSSGTHALYVLNPWVQTLVLQTK